MPEIPIIFTWYETLKNDYLEKNPP